MIEVSIKLHFPPKERKKRNQNMYFTKKLNPDKINPRKRVHEKLTIGDFVVEIV